MMIYEYELSEKIFINIKKYINYIIIFNKLIKKFENKFLFNK